MVVSMYVAIDPVMKFYNTAYARIEFPNANGVVNTMSDKAENEPSCVIKGDAVGTAILIKINLIKIKTPLHKIYFEKSSKQRLYKFLENFIILYYLFAYF